MLSNKQIQNFKDDGFVVLRELYTKEEMKEITAWTDEVTNYPEVPNKYMMYFEKSKIDENQRILSRMENFEPYHAGFSQMFRDERMQGLTSQLFDEEAVLYKDKINFKMTGGDGFKAHQDVQAGWDKYASLHITALISVDQCTIENGCLEMAPGYHRSGLIGDEWKPLEDDALVYKPITTEPGDAIFFDSFAPHRSEPNLTNQARRVLYVTYNRLSEGDSRTQYYLDKRNSYPPDCERDPNKRYVFRV